MGNSTTRDERSLHQEWCEHYDEVELGTLQRIFRSLSKLSGNKRSGSVEKQLFLQLFSSGSSGLPGLYAERLFHCFDKDSNGEIEFKEFLAGLAVLSRGTRETLS